MPGIDDPSTALTLRRRSERWTAVVSAMLYVAVGTVCGGEPGRRERRLFAAANHDVGHQALLRVPQQLGTPWVLPTLSVVGFCTHRRHLAVTGACALPVEKALEVALKKVLQRDRPARVDPEVELRDDAPAQGPFPPLRPCRDRLHRCASGRAVPASRSRRRGCDRRRRVVLRQEGTFAQRLHLSVA
jgi:hypothetical protein